LGKPEEESQSAGRKMGKNNWGENPLKGKFLGSQTLEGKRKSPRISKEEKFTGQLRIISQ